MTKLQQGFTLQLCLSAAPVKALHTGCAGGTPVRYRDLPPWAPCRLQILSILVVPCLAYRNLPVQEGVETQADCNGTASQSLKDCAAEATAARPQQWLKQAE